MISGPRAAKSAARDTTLSRNCGSSTVRESDWMMTISWMGLVSPNPSSSNLSAREDSAPAAEGELRCGGGLKKVYKFEVETESCVVGESTPYDSENEPDSNHKEWSACTYSREVFGHRGSFCSNIGIADVWQILPRPCIGHREGRCKREIRTEYPLIPQAR